jgi:DNA-binding response OmpR family regulator
VTSDALSTPTVLIYSSNRTTREAVRLALGSRPAPELPRIEIVEVATEPIAVRRIAEGGIDTAILDGESVPAGGMGVCRTIKDEVFDAPPVLLIVGRAQDAWLASWSKADAVLAQPLDPIAVAASTADLLRARIARPSTGAR